MNVFDVIGTLAICVYSTSLLTLIPIVIVLYLANLMRKYYMKTQREVARYAKSTNSPVVSGFLSAIAGLSTIRAFKRERDFTTLQNADFDINKKVRLTESGLENWFANTLSILCFCISMPCIAYCMFGAKSDSSVIGLLMSYSLYLVFGVAGTILS